MVMFMPWPTKLPSRLEGIVLVLGTTLPAWFMWPNLATGCWRDCYADPDKIRLLNGFLLLMRCADKARVTCYIECIPECKLIESGTMVQVCYYRLHIPLTKLQVKSVILAFCMELQPVEDEEEDVRRANKRRRRNSGKGNVIVEPEIDFHMTNTAIGARNINSWPAFFQWYTTCMGMESIRSKEIIFDIPPECGMVLNNFAPPALYDDDTDDDDNAPDDDDSTDPDEGAAFQAWYENLPPNHILKMLDMRLHFKNGTARHGTRLKTCQLNFAEYFHNGVFQFPEFCDNHELVTEIKFNAPWLGGDVDNLIFADFAHCAATLTMLPDELFRKMQSTSAITGRRLPEHYRAKSLAELRVIWSTQSAGDISQYSAITMLPPAERHVNPSETESMKILASMYPAYGRYTESASGQFTKLQGALLANAVNKNDCKVWVQESIDRINQLYADSPKDGFVGAYFRICSEANGIRRGLYGMTDDPILLEAKRLIYTTIAGMSPAHSMLALQAKLLRGSLHMTPAQASPLLTVWNASMTALEPEINKAQPTFCLLGGSDTGKSAFMDLFQWLVQSQAVIRQDTTSKLAVTAHGELGVQCTDELKTGVDTQGAHEATNWLTSWSTGWHVHERLRLGTQPGEPTVNITTKSDRRRFMVTATNHKPHPNFASRMRQLYMAGNQIAGDITRQELATLCDNTVPWHAAKMVFQFQWADHEAFWRVHQHLRWYICTSLFPVWHNIVCSVLGKKFAPSTREVKCLANDAKGFFLNRIISEYRQTAMQEEDGSPVSFVEYAMAKSVVSLQDYTLCLLQQRQTSDKSNEENIILAALLNNIVIDEEPTGAQLRVYDREYYTTSLSSVQEVCARTEELTASHGIGKDIMTRLEATAKNGGHTLVVKARGGRTHGTYAVHKSLIKVSGKGKLVTSGMQTILNFFSEQIRRAVPQGAPSKWYVGMDETKVVFKSSIRKRLLQPFHEDTVESDVLINAGMQETDVLRSLLLLEASGAVRYRDMAEPHPYTLNAVGTILSQDAGAKGVLVNRGGPMDDLRVFGTTYTEETPDAEISPEWVKEQARKIHAEVEPRVRQYKSPIRLVDVVTVDTEVLRTAVDSVLYTKLKVPPPVDSDDVSSSLAMHSLIDAVAAVSGEAPGSVWFAGSSDKSVDAYATHVVREYPHESITLKNPYRNTGKSAFSTRSDLTDYVLPAEQQNVTFSCRGSTLIRDLEKKVAAINMVEYALLPPQNTAE
jgi:hypothetical protein